MQRGRWPWHGTGVVLEVGFFGVRERAPGAATVESLVPLLALRLGPWFLRHALCWSVGRSAIDYELTIVWEWEREGAREDCNSTTT